MEPRLIQQQSQKLILSPQMRQYLKLLELPMMELETAIENALAENPCLEEKPSSTSSQESLPSPDGETPPITHGAEELRLGEGYDHLSDLDENYKDNFDSLDFSRQDPKSLQERKLFQENLLTRPEALSDFLAWQLRFLDLDEEQFRIAEEIIGSIDDDGYLREMPEAIAGRMGKNPEEILKVLMRIHELDPPGIGARNLQETLLLQIRKKSQALANREEPENQSACGDLQLAETVVANHLPLLEKRDWQALARALNVSPERIKRAAFQIARLAPKPGRSFRAENFTAAPPDSSVTINENDENGRNPFKIEIHNEPVREIRLSPYYRRLMRSKSMDARGRTFLREKMRAALIFLRSLDLRQSTLQAITEEIVKAQPEFLEKGFAYLKPLRLKDVAAKLGIHESTVSRAIHSKTILTPQGLIPYKSFFSTRLETGEGDESQKSMMEKIRALIESEDRHKPLSDQEIVKRLDGQNIHLARRTVAKYREMMKILPTHLRRER